MAEGLPGRHATLPHLNTSRHRAKPVRRLCDRVHRHGSRRDPVSRCCAHHDRMQSRRQGRFSL